MDTITLSHNARQAAIASPTRVWFAAHIETLPDSHPRKRLICFMALYARDILTGILPGPYTDRDAELVAVASIIPTELLERAQLNIARVADTFDVPADALARTHARWPHQHPT